jgi:hypothetical protein
MVLTSIEEVNEMVEEQTADCANDVSWNSISAPVAVLVLLHALLQVGLACEVLLLARSCS